MLQVCGGQQLRFVRKQWTFPYYNRILAYWDKVFIFQMSIKKVELQTLILYCNKEIKFKNHFQNTLWLATGHYAPRVKDENGQGYY